MSRQDDLLDRALLGKFRATFCKDCTHKPCMLQRQVATRFEARIPRIEEPNAMQLTLPPEYLTGWVREEAVAA